MYELDAGRLHWTNLTTLETCYRELQSCLSYLDRLPTLRKLKLESWIIFEDEESEELEFTGTLPTELIAQLLEHPLEKLSVTNSTTTYLLMYDAALTVYLAKSLKNLQKLTIQKERSNEIIKAIEDTVQEYPHMDNIEIYYSRW